MNRYAQAITQSKRDAQGRIVTVVLNDNLRKAQLNEGIFPYRTITDLQISGRDLQVVQSIGVPDGIEPRAPAFSGPPSNCAKRFTIN
jgi:hypothetical protein